MGASRETTERDELVRLPVGGSFIVSDELGNELFRVTAADDAVVASGQRLPALRTVAIEVTAAQIAEGATIEAIPALGAGKGPIIVSADFLYLAGDVPFGVAVQPLLKDGDDETVATVDDVPLSALVSTTQPANATTSVPSTGRINQAVDLVIPAADYRGAILTHAIADDGSGYQVGDTITLESPEGTTAPIVTVATVDGGGAVLTYTLTEAGTASPVGNIVQESTSGSGEGFELDVLTISEDSDGTGRLLVTYYEAALA